MASLNDCLFGLERDLARYPGLDAASLFARRTVLRKALGAHGDERYREGYGDGRRDTVETRQLAEELEQEDGDA